METINNGMCRCCASEGTFKDVMTRYQWMGEEEVYADMLRECFDITLTPSDDGLEAGICEVCITQLRNSANFKKQVQRTEEQFKRRLDDLPFKSNIVKVEASPLEDPVHGVSDDDSKFSDEICFSGDFEEVPIKTESSDEMKSKKRSAKATSSRSKQPKLEAETSSKRLCRKSRKAIIKIGSEKKKATQKKILVIAPDPPVRVQMTKRKEVNKHQENIASIILSSNATPIRSWGGSGYSCSFCATDFLDPKQLKHHTLTTHGNDDKSIFMVGCSMINFIVKLDITNLQCKLCSYSLAGLDELENHLTASHGKFFHKDLKNHVVPFRFDGEDLRCVICKNEFNNFKVLLEHMNRHFRNYVCDVCDSGFVNQRMLQTHSYRHKKGVFICPQCSKVFDNKVKQKEHERAVHVRHNKRSKCGYCGERFSDYTKKNDHMVKMHGAKALVLKCQACSKSFDNQRSLTVHTKSYHLLEGRVKK